MMACASAGGVSGPKFIVPRHRRLTLRPERPRWVYSILLAFHDPGGAVGGDPLAGTAATYSAASLAGPALAALLAAWFGARLAVLTAAALVALAGPAALSLSRYPPLPRTAKVPAPHRQVAAGFATILTRRKL